MHVCTHHKSVCVCECMCVHEEGRRLGELLLSDTYSPLQAEPSQAAHKIVLHSDRGHGPQKTFTYCCLEKAGPHDSCVLHWVVTAIRQYEDTLRTTISYFRNMVASFLCYSIVQDFHDRSENLTLSHKHQASIRTLPNVVILRYAKRWIAKTNFWK